MSFRDSPTYHARAAAAALGCGACGGAIVDPINGGDPFSGGPYQGRYLCQACWTCFYDEHPDYLADDASRRYVAAEAAAIRKSRGWELLFEEGDHKVYLTARGTLLIKLAPREGYGAHEYHPEDFQLLLRALAEIDQKGVVGFTFQFISTK